jgi:hypothetical protein
MISETDSNTSWLDDIKELIRKKREENLALQKVQESLQSIGKGRDITPEIPEDEDQLNDITIKDQPVITKTINTNQKQKL